MTEPEPWTPPEPWLPPPPWTPPERLLTPQQASIRTGLRVKTLRKYADEGLLACVRRGSGRRLYPENAVRALRPRKRGTPLMASLITHTEMAKFRKALEALDETDYCPPPAVPALIGTARKHMREAFASCEARHLAGGQRQEADGAR